MTRRPCSETRVDAAPLPYQGVLWHPELGVLEVRLSSPVADFVTGDVAASQSSPTRWFVSSPGPWHSLREVEGWAILEHVNDRRERENQPILGGYLEADLFPDLRAAEEFAARRDQRVREKDRLRAESRGWSATMNARAGRRSWWRDADEEFEVDVAPAIEEPDRWILTPRASTKSLPRAGVFEVTFDRGWVPGAGGPFPVGATVRALGTSDASTRIELGPHGDAGEGS